MKLLDERRFRLGYAIVSLFTVLAGDAVRYSVGWWGFGAAAIAITVVSVLLLWRHRDRWSIGGLPFLLLAFLAFATASIVWSYYPGATALGTLVTWMTAAVGLGIAVSLDWPGILRALGWAIRTILVSSILFELWVSIFVGKPIFPLVPAPGMDYSTLDEVPDLYYWSRNLLLAGDKIQGIVGNSALLGFVALLGLIVFGIQLVSASVSKPLGIASLSLATLTVLLTRSATITVAIVVLAAVVVAVVLLRLARTGQHRGFGYAGLLTVVVSGILTALTFRSSLLGLLGKDDTLTDRTSIWADVIDLAQQRPVLGWGWVSFWIPWVSPFDTLHTAHGVRQLHAHNAWLDLWLQLGIVGAVIVALVVLAALVRSWVFATNRMTPGAAGPARFTALSFLPLLLLTALVVQTFAESRLLVEYGIVLLVIAAVKTHHVAAEQPDPALVVKRALSGRAAFV
ncbi:O-antigen ligase family protein [Glaciihabitans arcticus]|uniref:O-antigen ligase family protein n=1 Tax=Glaciihabitans arcticus TaxID=2668039 RepID=A0A4Q9GMH6_9MICO|nr:O-antigen ligase family protein [Glaciihabitans arcticus]TBN55972.1 O-antigen ligase family protein [Glaciihabitans arcticus]